MNFGGMNNFNQAQKPNNMNIMQMLMSGMNPNQIMQSIIRNNPQAQVVLNQMQQSGMNPQQYAQQLARQNNIDLNPMLNMLRKSGYKI